MKSKKLWTLLITLTLIYAVPLWADWHEEEQRINFLLEQMGQVDGYFLRNGEEYAPLEAVSHLKMKLKNVMDSWFAPDKDKWTAEMFIDKIASKSSFSGKLYQIRFKSGQIVNTGEWLNKRLKDFKVNESHKQGGDEERQKTK